MRHATTTCRGHVGRFLAAGCLVLLGAGALATVPRMAPARVSEPTAAATAAPETVVSGPATTFRGARGLVSDWGHIRQVAAWLRYRTPPRRVVYLLGGSGSRESVTDEAGWSRQLRRKTGRRVAAYVLSSNCQTFVEDARIIKALPKGRGIALINVGLSRFIMYHVPDTISSRAERKTPPSPWWQHHYDGKLPHSLSWKREYVRYWHTNRLGVFTARYDGRLEELTALVDLCLRRGVRPVLLEMPLCTAAARHDLDDPLARYRRDCKALAADRGIRYLSFLSTIRLRSSDFYDLWHLLRTGRAKWQDRLSRELVAKHIL